MAFVLDRFGNETYAAMRIVTGLLFLWHGTSKLLGFPAPSPDAPAFVIYVAGGIELVGGVLVMIGLFTSPVAFLCSGLMAAAYWMAHGMNDLFPLNNGGELAALYCFVFLYISAKGPGIWSVDASRPVASARRRAARPVGAASARRSSSCSKRSRRKRVSIVLPVPGPPVITSTWRECAIRSASI